MTVLAPRLILVLALAAITSPALSETVRRSARPPTRPTPVSDRERSRGRPLSPEELSASAGGAGPAQAAPDARAQRLATVRRAIDQLLNHKTAGS